MEPKYKHHDSNHIYLGYYEPFKYDLWFDPQKPWDIVIRWQDESWSTLNYQAKFNQNLEYVKKGLELAAEKGVKIDMECNTPRYKNGKGVFLEQDWHSDIWYDYETDLFYFCHTDTSSHSYARAFCEKCHPTSTCYKSYQKAKEKGLFPRYDHDRQNAIFLGQIGENDYWLYDGTIIRQVSEGFYFSYSFCNCIREPLAEAYAIAKSRGLIKEMDDACKGVYLGSYITLGSNITHKMWYNAEKEMFYFKSSSLEVEHAAEFCKTAPEKSSCREAYLIAKEKGLLKEKENEPRYGNCEGVYLGFHDIHDMWYDTNHKMFRFRYKNDFIEYPIEFCEKAMVNSSCNKAYLIAKEKGLLEAVPSELKISIVDFEPTVADLKKLHQLVVGTSCSVDDLINMTETVQKLSEEIGGMDHFLRTVRLLKELRS